MNKQTAPKTEVVTLQPAALTTESVHPGTMITALQAAGNVDIKQLKGLFKLQKKYDDEIARKAYHAAKAQFAALAPTIAHDGKVSFKETHYSFASLAATMDQIKEALMNCGLNASWKIGERDNGDISVTCFLTHALGYQEETSLSAPRNAGGGSTGMNALQSAKSTVSYLERITMYALLGLASKADDDDGKFGGDDHTVVSAKEAAELETLFTEVGGDEKKFLANFRVNKFEEVPLAQFARAMSLLEDKRKANDKS